jgi:hypothetical protein
MHFRYGQMTDAELFWSSKSNDSEHVIAGRPWNEKAPTASASYRVRSTEFMVRRRRPLQQRTMRCRWFSVSVRASRVFAGVVVSGALTRTCLSSKAWTCGLGYLRRHRTCQVFRITVDPSGKRSFAESCLCPESSTHRQQVHGLALEHASARPHLRSSSMYHVRTRSPFLIHCRRAAKSALQNCSGSQTLTRSRIR